MHRATVIERTEQHIRQMCCLAASGPLIAPMLFSELRAVLPFASCLYIWLDPSGPVDAFFTDAPRIGQYLPLDSDRYFQRLETNVWASPLEAAVTAAHPRHLYQVLHISKTAYFTHPIYNEILRPSNAHTFLHFPVDDNGVPVGVFMIGRGPRDRDFDAAELRMLQRLKPFISHGLALRSANPFPDVSAESAAMIIVDSEGRMHSMSASARSLLSLSQGSAMAPALLHDGLISMVQSLARSPRGDHTSISPAWSTDNAWGHFSACAYWLERRQSAESLIGILLERRTPRHLKLLDGLRRLALPVRQEQVGLLLALGRSEEQAARELGLSRNTVVYHRRQVYNRLEVESRSLLVERLIGAAGMAGAGLEMDPVAMSQPRSSWSATHRAPPTA